jgi:hypothetical protein
MSNERLLVAPAWLAMPAQILIDGGQVTLQTCTLYKSHRCAILNGHHVVPESWWLAAGRQVDTPLRSICPTCHFNTHAAIDALIHDPPRGTELLPPRTVALAHLGVQLALAAGLTPAPTL